MKKEYKANIVVSNIEVDDRYYNFDYEVEIEGMETIKGNYENDYCNGDSKEEWKKHLEESNYCLSIVLEEIGGSI